MGLYETRLERLASWARGHKAGPVTIELVPTDRCNLNCMSCWRQGWKKDSLESRYADEMSDERLLKLVDEAAEIGVKEFAFVGGGEPLVRGVTQKLIRKIKVYGMECDLVTNGAMLNSGLAEEFVRIGVDRIKVSVDGVDAKTHDYLRGVAGTFDTVMSNIRKISELKRKTKAEKPSLLFNTVVSAKNYTQLPGIARLGGTVGLDGIWLLPLTAFDESSKHLKLNIEQSRDFVPILGDAIDVCRQLGIENNFSNFTDMKYMDRTESMGGVMMEEARKTGQPAAYSSEIMAKEYPKSGDPLEDFKNAPCYTPWYHATIIPNGNIAPCFSPWVWNAPVSVKDHSLKELWFGEYFDGFRRDILGRTLTDNCNRCCVWEVFNNRRIREGIERLIRVNGVN